MKVKNIFGTFFMCASLLLCNAFCMEALKEKTPTNDNVSQQTQQKYEPFPERKQFFLINKNFLTSKDRDISKLKYKTGTMTGYHTIHEKIADHFNRILKEDPSIKSYDVANFAIMCDVVAQHSIEHNAETLAYTCDMLGLKRISHCNYEPITSIGNLSKLNLYCMRRVLVRSLVFDILYSEPARKILGLPIAVHSKETLDAYIFDGVKSWLCKMFMRKNLSPIQTDIAGREQLRDVFAVSSFLKKFGCEKLPDGKTTFNQWFLGYAFKTFRAFKLDMLPLVTNYNLCAYNLAHPTDNPCIFELDFTSPVVQNYLYSSKDFSQKALRTQLWNDLHYNDVK